MTDKNNDHYGHNNVQLLGFNYPILVFDSVNKVPEFRFFDKTDTDWKNSERYQIQDWRSVPPQERQNSAIHYCKPILIRP